MNLETALETALGSHQKVTVWAAAGDVRAKIFTIKVSADGEPMLYPPYRSGGHLTLHLSGEADASDGYDYRRKDSWMPTESKMRRALESLLTRLRPDTPLLTLRMETDEWVRLEPNGAIILDLERIVEALVDVEIHLVTPRILSDEGLDLGPVFLNPEVMEVVQLLSEDGEALALPVGFDHGRDQRRKLPVIGPLQELLDGLIDRSKHLEETGQIKESRENASWRLLQERVVATIDTADWDRMRLFDHIRGRAHRIDPSGNQREEHI